MMDIYIHDTYFEISNTTVAVVAIVLLLIVACVIGFVKLR
ncbi:MAG: hypothetical protein JWP89_4206 [Schlesneria sp.]|nr:hypothetical protein [Schlesneria sp.]